MLQCTGLGHGLPRKCQAGLSGHPLGGDLGVDQKDQKEGGSGELEEEVKTWSLVFSCFSGTWEEDAFAFSSSPEEAGAPWGPHLDKQVPLDQ